MQGWRNAQSCSEFMWESDCGFVPVIGSNGDGALAGVTTDRHMAMATYIQGEPPPEILVSSVMTREPICCHVGDDVAEAEILMRTNQVRRLPVIDSSGHLVGILSLNDIAREVPRADFIASP